MVDQFPKSYECIEMPDMHVGMPFTSVEKQRQLARSDEQALSFAKQH